MSDAALRPAPAKVLIVDDEPNILLSLKFLMTKAGYSVRTAKDGEEALAEVGRDKPDLMLLDVMMPKLDGFSVCQKIKSTPELRDVRVVMLTARGRDIERRKGLDLGADDYITKPFSTKDALDRVAALLQPRAVDAVSGDAAAPPSEGRD
ncbi:MAG: response regulator [Akkermansiaceae bacterium]|nr:response regulator [Akkermansiaceae bacterium]